MLIFFGLFGLIQPSLCLQKKSNEEKEETVEGSVLTASSSPSGVSCWLPPRQQWLLGLRARWWWCIQAERGRKEGERLVSPINDRRSEAGGNGCSFVGNINLGRSSTSVSEREASMADRWTDRRRARHTVSGGEAGVNRVSAWPRVTEREGSEAGGN